MSEMKKDRFDPDAEVFEDVHEDPPSLKLDEVNSNIHTSEQTQVPERTSKSDDILRWDDEAQLRSLGSDLSRMMEEQGDPLWYEQ